jgi:hypothetical protein
MVSVVLVVAVILLFIYKTFKYMTYRPENFPPGPPRLPIFGSYLFVQLMDRKNIHKTMMKLAKYYKTDLIGFYHGPVPVVVVNSQKLVKEMLVRPEFDGRNDFLVTRLREPKYQQNGEIVKENLIRIMRKLSFLVVGEMRVLSVSSNVRKH